MAITRWEADAFSLAIPESIIHEVQEAAEGIIASRYMTYSFFALLIYDHILTLPDEITIVWLGRRSLVKVLFLLNRYVVPFLIAIDVATLTGYMPLTKTVDVVLEMLSLLTTTLIITFRIHAILGNIRGLLPVLLSVWAAQAVVSAVLVVVMVNIKAGPTITVQPVFNVCFAILDRVYTIWIPSMFFHTLVFILLVWKALSTPRDAQTPLLKLLLRDGMIFYTVVFLAMLFNLIVWAVAPITLAILPHDPVWAVCNMALSRLMLSVNNLPTSTPPSGEGDHGPKSRPISMTTIPPRRTMEMASHSQPNYFDSNGLESGTLVLSSTGTPIDRLDFKRANSISSLTDHDSKRSNKKTHNLVYDQDIANPDWYPGAISDVASQQMPTPTSRRTFSISRATPPTPPKLSIDSDSSLPFVRPLPQPPAKMQLGTAPEDLRPPPQRRNPSDDNLKMENISELINLPSKGSRTISVLRGLRTVGGEKTTRSTRSRDLMGEVRTLPDLPPAAALENVVPQTALYRLPTQREVPNRNGELRITSSGGVEF